ncbi:hypothetical protein EI94DRAFT_1790371 [Lactarius quietus]|nr:hypothetical protein EI94DRAFT_1790371 [Lactarius quietus]
MHIDRMPDWRWFASYALFMSDYHSPTLFDIDFLQFLAVMSKQVQDNLKGPGPETCAYRFFQVGRPLVASSSSRCQTGLVADSPDRTTTYRQFFSTNEWRFPRSSLSLACVLAKGAIGVRRHRDVANFGTMCLDEVDAWSIPMTAQYATIMNWHHP